MIPCRACALVHSPLERCEVARRRAGIEVHRIEAGPVKTRQNPTKPTKCLESDALGSLRSGDLGAVDTLALVVHAAGSSRHGKYAKATADARKAYRRAWMRRRRAEERS